MVRRCLSEAESEGKWMMTRAPARKRRAEIYGESVADADSLQVLTLPNPRPLAVEMCGDLFPRGMMVLRTYLWREASLKGSPRPTQATRLDVPAAGALLSDTRRKPCPCA